jgi:transposase
MVDNKEQRVCVKFCFLLWKSAAETSSMQQGACKEECFSKAQVYEWYSRFKRAEMSCEDQPRSGRPSTCRSDENLEKVRNDINVDRSRTIDKKSEITGLSWSSCCGRDEGY